LLRKDEQLIDVKHFFVMFDKSQITNSSSPN